MRKQSILQYLSDNPSAKTADIAESIGISDGRARVYLLELVRDKIIIAEGETHNRTYRINGKNLC